MALTLRSAASLSRRFVLTRSSQTLFRTLTTIPLSQKVSKTSRTRLFACASSAATVFALASAPQVFAEFSSIAATTAQSSLPDITLYQYEVCPFCNKVRAYLDYHNIPYRVVEVDPLRKTELKDFSEDYRKVPIAVVNGEQVNGSDKVIDCVHQLTKGRETPVSPDEKKWLKWLDDYFIHLIAPNIYRTPTESLQTFEYIADNSKFSAWQRSTIRYTGAAAMYFVGRKIKKKYDIEDEREAIHHALREWTDAITKAGTPFLAGPEPGVADLSIFGVLKAIRTFNTFSEVRDKNQELADWFDRTSEAVGDPCVTDRQ
ncbi:Glutaredoxin [Gracilaria domingensis]|nr:Glutaredoxin [Gracilaria domingensis]